MPKVKLTKTALKQERDSLKQFQRFLPTLQLKKQQLQMEMRTCLDRIEKNRQFEQATKMSDNPIIASVPKILFPNFILIFRKSIIYKLLTINSQL